MEIHNREDANKFGKGTDPEEMNRLRAECLGEMYSEQGKYFLTKDEDSLMDGMLYFWERIPMMMERFKPGPCSFKLYCRSSARKYMRTSKVRNYSTMVCDTVANKRLGMNDWHEDAELPDRPCRGVSLDSLKPFDRKAWRKRIYILALKSAWYLTEDETIRRIAKVVGMEESVLQDQLQELRLLAEKGIRNLCWLEERRDFWYGKLCVSEQKLQGYLLPEEIERGKIEAQRYRDRLAAANSRIRSLKISPMHIDISRISGIPKGTVDTVLKRVREYSEKELDDIFGVALRNKTVP